MKDPKTVIANPMIETRREKYDTFLDYAWIKSISVPPQLEAALNSLLMSWKEAANTHRMPFLMVEQMRAFADGYAQSRPPKGRRLLNAVHQKLSRDIHLTRTQRKQTLAVLKRADQAERIARDETCFPADRYWELMIRESEMLLSITGSQSLAFCAQLFAYECFVVSCFEAVGGNPKRRPSDDRFWDEFQRLLSGDPRTSCWDAPVIATAREVRNSIAHRAGRVKTDLMRKDHGFHLSNFGVVSIMPENNIELHGVLRTAVTQLAAEVSKKLPDV